MASAFSFGAVGGGSGGYAPSPSFDQQWWLRNKNPFTRILTSPGAAPDTQIAGSLGDLARGLDWRNIELAKILRPSSGGLNTFAGATPSNLMPSNPFAGGDPNAPQRVVKNPALQGVVDSVLSRVGSLPTDPNVNTNVVRTNVRDPATATRIGAAGQRFDVDVNDTRQSFTDFTRAFREAQPQAQQFFDEEAGAIGRVYDQGPAGVQGQLNRLSAQRQAAITTQAQRAMRNALASTNAGRMLTGDSGYLDAVLADATGNIGAQAARERFDLDRLNLLGVTDMQTRLGGRRGTLQDAMLSRGLLPIEAQQRLAGNELAQLAGLSNLTNSNTFFNLDSPEQMLARQLGLLGQTAQIDDRNNFWRQPYSPETSGMLPIGSPPRSRGGFDFPMNDMFDDGSGYAPRGGGLSQVPTMPTMDLSRPSFLQSPAASRSAADQWLPEDFYEFPERYPGLVQQQQRLLQMHPEYFFGG